MFDMGMWEILLIFVILLIVVGPERLPKLARTLGIWVSKARSMVSSVRSEVERELRVEELRRSIKEQTESEQFRKLSDEVKSFGDDVRGVEREMRSSADHDATRVADAFRSGRASETDRTASAGDEPVDRSSTTNAAHSGDDRNTADHKPPDSSPSPSARNTANTAAERGSE